MKGADGTYVPCLSGCLPKLKILEMKMNAETQRNAEKRRENEACAVLCERLERCYGGAVAGAAGYRGRRGSVGADGGCRLRVPMPFTFHVSRFTHGGSGVRGRLDPTAVGCYEGFTFHARRALRPCLFLLSAFLISAFPRPIILANSATSPHVPLSRGNHARLLENCEPFGSVEQPASSALTLADTYENN